MQPNKDMIDVGEIIAKIQMPPNLEKIYNKTVLAGMRIAFDKRSHKMLLEQLDKPGPLAAKMTEGLIALMYMLWTKSNKTLPPQIIIPVTVTLTLRVFEFMQQSGESEATKELLGEVMADTVEGVMDRFGVKVEQVPELVKQGGANQEVENG